MDNRNILIKDVAFCQKKSIDNSIHEKLKGFGNTLGEVYDCAVNPSFENRWLLNFDKYELERVYRVLENYGMSVYIEASQEIKKPENNSILKVKFHDDVRIDSKIKIALSSCVSTLGDLSALKEEQVLKLKGIDKIGLEKINSKLISFGLNKLYCEKLITSKDDFEDAKMLPILKVVFSDDKRTDTRIKNALKLAGYSRKTLGDLSILKKSQLSRMNKLGDYFVDIILSTMNNFGLPLVDDEEIKIITPDDNIAEPKNIPISQIVFSDVPKLDTYARQFIFRWIKGKRNGEYLPETREQIFDKLSNITLGQIYNWIQNVSKEDCVGIGDATIKAIKDTLKSFGFDVQDDIKMPKRLKYGDKIEDLSVVRLSIFKFTSDKKLNSCVHQILSLAICKGDKEKYEQVMLSDFLSMDKEKLSVLIGSEVLKIIESALLEQKLAFFENDSEKE